MDITVVNISIGPHELNVESLGDLDLSKVIFNVTSRLRYSKESDYAGFQIDMMIMQENTQVFKSGFLVGLAISDWAKDMQNGQELNMNRDKLLSIAKTVWLVAIGIVAIQTSTENFGGIILPEPEYESFINDIILIPSAK